MSLLTEEDLKNIQNVCKRVNRQHWEDLTQEVAMTVHRCGSYDRSISRTKYFYHIAIRRNIDRIRKQSSRISTSPLSGCVEPVGTMDFEDPMPRIEFTVKNKKHQEMFDLYLRGVPWATIAAMMGISLGSVKSTIHRIKSQWL